MTNISLSVGGVPEHFNLPWHLSMEEGKFEKAGIHLHWQDYGGGTGAMAADLRENRLDLALLLTEGAVADISKGSNYRIASLFVQSPLIWGIHVPQNSPYQKVEELEGKCFAISRYGSGSHLMAFVNARQQSWNSADLSFEVVGNLQGARQALAAGRGDSFMWEKFMTKPLVDSGEWRRIGECPTPWPCFVLVVRNEIAEQQFDAVQQVLNLIREACVELKQNAEAIHLIASRYDLRKEDAEVWFREVKWAADEVIQKQTLQEVIDSLQQLGLLEKTVSPHELVNSFCRLI